MRTHALVRLSTSSIEQLGRFSVRRKPAVEGGAVGVWAANED